MQTGTVRQSLSHEAALLEVIAITPDDAIAAECGGADRLEVLSEIDAGGLTPALNQFQQIPDAVDLPLRIMLRSNSGFQMIPSELDRLNEQIVDLRRAGADQFVFGFLDDAGRLDRKALLTICTAIAPCPWTLHHAYDHVRDPAAAWDAAGDLAGLDCVLSGGVRGDLGRGLQTLCDRADWQNGDVTWLAGGGLILDYVESLLQAGIRAFHIGRAARLGHAWDQPVSTDAVRQWRRRLDTDG